MAFLTAAGFVLSALIIGTWMLRTTPAGTPAIAGDRTSGTAVSG